MHRDDVRYQAYVQILKEELIPAMGCTEPIALAYGAARAREILGCLPERIDATISGNIIKNVKSVIVPNTGGLKGIESAIAAGVVAGIPSLVLQVLSKVSDEQRGQIKDFLSTCPITVKPAPGNLIFDIDLKLYAANDNVRIRISEYHTNVVLIEKNGEIVFDAPELMVLENGLTDRSMMNVKDILDFADTVDLDDVRELLDKQIEYNTAISNEGLKNPYGASVGQVLLATYGSDDVKIRAKARAAAGSDARMSGCEMPVIIVSGSGNQGMAASLPVIEYAEHLGKSREELLRALVVSDLITIHQKTSVGRLSAFCGAINAGCGSGAGIAYLMGGDFNAIAHTLINALAIVSGIVCDGAKASCAAKIAAAVDAGLLGYHMYRFGTEFKGGDGIITKGVEDNIARIGRLAKDGMRETDLEIIRMMVED